MVYFMILFSDIEIFILHVLNLRPNNPYLRLNYTVYKGSYLEVLILFIVLAVGKIYKNKLDNHWNKSLNFKNNKKNRYNVKKSVHLNTTI